MIRRRVSPGSLCTFLAIISFSLPLGAADIYVDRWDDAHNFCAIQGCSLREAIDVANGNGEYNTIYLPAGTINLSRAGAGEDGNDTGDLDISASLTIVGHGPGVSIVDANYIDRVFHITSPSAAVFFQKMTIQNGGRYDMGGSGAGIRADGSWVKLLHCDVTGGLTPVGVTGAGIYVGDNGTLWLEESSIRGNTSSSNSAAITVGGSTPSSAILQIDRSTISDNFASDCPGAVFYKGDTGLIRDSTISANTCIGYPDGGSILVQGQLSLISSTLTGNSDPVITMQGIASETTLERNIIHGQCEDGDGLIVTAYGNLESPGDTCDLDPDGDLRNVASPVLYPLGYYGGATQTHRPAAASMAVDHVFGVVVPGCPRPDQRGISRPQNGAGGIGTPCDIGAVELVLDEIFIDGFEYGYIGSWSASEW